MGGRDPRERVGRGAARGAAGGSRLPARVGAGARLAHRGGRDGKFGRLPGERGRQCLRRLVEGLRRALRARGQHRWRAPRGGRSAAAEGDRAPQAEAPRCLRFRRDDAAGAGLPRLLREGGHRGPRLRARGPGGQRPPAGLPLGARGARRRRAVGALAARIRGEEDRRGGARARPAQEGGRACLRARHASRAQPARERAQGAAVQPVARRAARRLPARARCALHPRARRGRDCLRAGLPARPLAVRRRGGARDGCSGRCSMRSCGKWRRRA